jgi:hypothetical protein
MPSATAGRRKEDCMVLHQGYVQHAIRRMLSGGRVRCPGSRSKIIMIATGIMAVAMTAFIMLWSRIFIAVGAGDCACFRQATLISVKYGMLILTGVVATLLASLSGLATRPLGQLMTSVKAMQNKELISHQDGCAAIDMAVDTGDAIGHLAAPFDRISAKLHHAAKSMEDLAYQATHDGLTGLPIRSLLADRLEQIILATQRYAKEAAVPTIREGFAKVDSGSTALTSRGSAMRR